MTNSRDNKRRTNLNKHISRLHEDSVKEVFTKCLDLLENAFLILEPIGNENPNHKQQRKEQIFKELRSKILRIGNNNIRKFDDSMNIYFVDEITYKDIINIKNYNK